MFADLQAKLIALLVGLLALVAAGGAGLWYGHSWGHASGMQEVQAKWDKSTAEGEAEREEKRGAGYKLASEYELKLRLLEQRYERVKIPKVAVVCPKSGMLDDVVIPAAVLDGMFNRERTDAGAPGSAASQPHGTVR